MIGLMRIATTVFLCLLLSTSCQEFSQSKDDDSSESAASDSSAADDLTKMPEDTKVDGEGSGSSKSETDSESSLRFQPGHITGTVNRGSSECCGPVKLGSAFRYFSINLSESVPGDLPSDIREPKIPGDLTFLRFSMKNQPEVGTAYPVSWGTFADDENAVYLRVISREESQLDWEQQGATVEGSVEFTKFEIDEEAPNGGSVTFKYDLTFSEGTLKGTVEAILSEDIVSCNRECDNN